MADVKRDFVFSSATDARQADVRAANALEFIAHYLDRIDGHLERLTAQAEGGQATVTKIALELSGIAQFVGKLRP